LDLLDYVVQLALCFIVAGQSVDNTLKNLWTISCFVEFPSPKGYQ
jgi:hypothetical protein